MFDSVKPAIDGGTDDCTRYTFLLPPATGNCAALMVRFEHANSPAEFAIDDLEITAELIFSPIVLSGGGIYTSSIRSCFPASIEVSCTWDDGTNPALIDTKTVVFQP